MLQAKARLAEVTGAHAPALAQDGRLVLIGARHPLLMRGVVSRYSDAIDDLPAAPVPVDITLEPPATALLITGPNTGGKTVALKTAGLLALDGAERTARAGRARLDATGIPDDLCRHR